MAYILYDGCSIGAKEFVLYREISLMLYYKNWPDFIQLLGDGLVTYYIQLVSLIKSGQLCHISVTVAVRVLINSGVAICPSQD